MNTIIEKLEQRASLVLGSGLTFLVGAEAVQEAGFGYLHQLLGALEAYIPEVKEYVYGAMAVAVGWFTRVAHKARAARQSVIDGIADLRHDWNTEKAHLKDRLRAFGEDV